MLLGVPWLNALVGELSAGVLDMLLLNALSDVIYIDAPLGALRL